MRTSKPGRLAHRAGRIGNRLVAADHEVAFGLAEHFMCIDAKRFADPAEQFAAERFTAGKDAAQFHAGIFTPA